MRAKVEVDPTLDLEEIVIKYHPNSKNIKPILDIINNLNDNKITCYKRDKMYYLDLINVIFFETDNNMILAHTINDMYKVRYKLYELEQKLPNNFIRISKSTIVNINDIYTINRRITSSSLIEFRKTHKQVYVSRFYYQKLILRLKERS